jgi:hypothetical protein
LALQRSTPSLPFQLIVPGRTLVRRGPLSHVERSAQPRDREFLLFSDCIVWLEAEEGWVGGNGSSAAPGPSESSPAPIRPVMTRTRSKSEAELPLRNASGEITPATPDSATRSVMPLLASRKSGYHHPMSRMKRSRHASSGTAEEGRWVYKGRVELVDLEVVVTPPREFGEERRFEVLSPGGSFVLYAGASTDVFFSSPCTDGLMLDSEEERDAWTSAIRQTKAQLFVSLNATHPDSTLTSSSSTAHLRRSLQALPFPPSDERLTTLKEGKGKGKKLERRGRVEHWVPAIWIPDEKTEGCMRCGRPFGWRRRRHHCRLCGRCICSSCSDRVSLSLPAFLSCALTLFAQTFFISDPNAPENSSKPARACNACYETVFPLLDNPLEDEDASTEPHSSMLDAHSNTLTSLSNFPSWLSMPSLPLASTTEALMAIDRGPQRYQSAAAKYERLRRGDISADPSRSEFDLRLQGEERSDMSHVEMAGERVRAVRSPPPRPRSYHQILEDFEESRLGITSTVQEDADEDADEDSSGSGAQMQTGVDADEEPRTRREDTARRNKRFSLPAVALQTTSVTARTQAMQDGRHRDGRSPGRTKRFSLVLGSRPSKTQSEMVGRGRIEEEDAAGPELAKGVAAGKLSELLGRHRPHRTT